jgi:Uma2 family endonuclease
MPAAKKTEIITIQEFETQYFDTRCQFHNGEVWQEENPQSETTHLQSVPDHSYLQFCIGKVIGNLFLRSPGPKGPGGWWLFNEVAVKYEPNSLFLHDLAGWKKSSVPERPRRYPITHRPDWVCEILSSNAANDLFKKKSVLQQHEVPYYWVVYPSEKIISVLKWSIEGYVSILDVTENFVGKIPPFDDVSLSANVLFGEEDD